ncbi:hypothetical protein B0A49_10617 [Cryomyces minteri]|uniref:GAR domain-containing protein n=1 Tax=Cryomyces minteri TaxID=331657 RepID=A0A4U0WQ48_9PEZI|nr:hypothetical protein B0A49_10617 [Cryomyces minteri]
MSTKDPILGGPQLSYSEQHRPVSRSPSRSPRKHARPTSLDSDPLLRDLSPTTTLRVLGASTDATGANNEDRYKFIGSINLASNSEKAFGIRVAKTTNQLRSWCRELEQWEWTGNFEVPAAKQRTAKRRRMVQSHLQSSNASRETFLDTSDSEEEEEYWGSLPSAQIRAYETRVEDIREELEELDVEELKNHVLQSHIPSRSRPVSSYSEPRSDLSSSSLAHLDEFTALITATILQALPHLSRLTQLLGSWSIRLAVLRRVPGFLKELKDTQNALRSGWTAIHPKHPATTNPSSTPSSPSSPSTAKYSVDMTRGASDTIRSVLENKVSELGHRLDSILDDLEGREETVPGSWIDEFESLEADYSCWAVEVERIAQESEWRTLVERDRNRHVPVQSAPINERAGLDIKDAPTIREDKFSGVPLSGRNMGSPVSAVYVPNGDAEGQQKTDLMYHAQGTASRQISTGLSQLGARDGLSSGSPTERGAEAKRKPTRVRSVPIVIDYESQGALPFEGSKYLSRPLESPTTPDAQASSLANHGGRSNHERGRSDASSADSPFDSATEHSLATTKYRTGKENRPLSPQDNSPARSFEKAPRAVKRFLSMTKSKSPHRSSRSRSGSDTRTAIGQLPAVKRDRSVGSPAKADSTAADRLSYGWPGRNKASVRIASLNGDVRPRSQASDTIQSEQASRSSSKRASRVVSAPERALALEPDITDVPDVPDVPEVPDVPNIITSTSVLGSPFASPTEATPPDNWPLIPQEEISSPKKTLAASSFERMFVDSLPNTPEVNAKGKSEENNPMEQAEPGTPKEPVVHGSVVDAEEPVAATSVAKAIVPPLNAAMSKRRGNEHVGIARRVKNFSKSSLDFRASNGSSATPEFTSNGSLPKQIAGNSEEQLQRKISTIIDGIPAHIRFASGPGPNAPEVARPRTAPTPPKPITGPALTLAPADSTPSKPGSDDIKLYHLSQAGKDQPIKLFVRLVGEGERVMVRVGGGWADLGEYLRQYAEHHGRRTVSDGKSEVAGLPPTTNISIRTLPTAGARTPLSSRPGSKLETSRPDSARSGRMNRLGHDETVNNGTPYAASSNTPTPAPRSASSNTPSSSSSTRPSPPSRSSSRLSWTGDEIGLAGPASSKRGEMSAAKQKWVEDMIEQAKKASGESKKALPETHAAGRGKVEFGGMGKAGGTRRVFLKGAETGGGE